MSDTKNRIHEKMSTQMKKNLSFDEPLITNYFINVIYLYLLDLLDFFYGFYFFFRGVGVNWA